MNLISHIQLLKYTIRRPCLGKLAATGGPYSLDGFIIGDKRFKRQNLFFRDPHNHHAKGTNTVSPIEDEDRFSLGLGSLVNPGGQQSLLT